MLVGILSDSHDHMERIRQAVAILKERGIRHVIHAGDFVAPFALNPLIEGGFTLFAVLGNNDGEIRGLRSKAEPLGGIQPSPYRFKLGGERFLVHHYPRADDRLAAEDGRIDFFIYGHTHRPDCRRVGEIVVINPGELCGWLEGKASFAILDVESGECEFIEL